MLNGIFGFISGIISGMGIGGGVVLIPLLALFTPLTQHEAQGINLLYFIPTAAAALVIHIKNKKIKLRCATKLAAFSIPWAFAASMLSLKIDAALLRKIFAVFLFAAGIYQIFSKEE